MKITYTADIYLSNAKLLEIVNEYQNSLNLEGFKSFDDCPAELVNNIFKFSDLLEIEFENLSFGDFDVRY